MYIFIAEFNWLLEVHDASIENLECSVRCYSEALQLEPDAKGDNFTALSKRLGNAYNELGVCQMQKALEVTQTEGTTMLMETTFTWFHLSLNVLCLLLKEKICSHCEKIISFKNSPHLQRN